MKENRRKRLCYFYNKEDDVLESDTKRETEMIRADPIKRDVLSWSLTAISQLLTFNLQQHVRFRAPDIYDNFHF